MIRGYFAASRLGYIDKLALADANEATRMAEARRRRIPLEHVSFVL